jgi:purine nucleosidase
VARAIVFDTDIGSDVDDALCLALALAAPELEICGLTTVGNESRRRAHVAAKLLSLAQRSDIPVFAGCRVPVLGGRGFNWFGHEAGETLEPGEEPVIADEHGVDALLRLSREHEALEIVAVGPLTNIAVALMVDPDLAGRVERLTVMGGHIRRVEYGGHVYALGVDYNLCSDPHASYLTLRSGIPTRLVTADVTLHTWITDKELDRIEAAGTEFHRVLAAETRAWTPIQKRIHAGAGCNTDDDNVAFLHDPLTLACAYDERFCTFEELEIEPQIEPSGVFRTLERDAPSEDSFPMRCATAVDAKAFSDHFTERVCGLFR